MRFLSNLGDCWEICNPEYPGTLTMEEFNYLISKVRTIRSCSATALLCMNGIAWSLDDEVIKEGTYGYMKAESFFKPPYNYLSNAVTLSCKRFKKPVQITVACQEKFEGSSILEEVLKLLGKSKKKYVFYAPEDENERSRWNNMRTDVEGKIERLERGLEKIYNNLPSDFIDDSRYINPGPYSSLNVKKIAKEYLVSSEWEITKENYSFPTSLFIKRQKNDVNIIIETDITHKGHRFHPSVRFDSFYFEKYCFLWKTCTVDTEDDVKKYLEDILIIGDYIYKEL